jgi:predicted kinase
VLIEFIGLPGSGKSTLIDAVADQLRKERLRCNTLRMVARDLMEDSRTHVRFLQRRAERVSLYGCFAFAHDNPALFDALLQSTRHDLARTLWNMDMLAHIHFVSKQPLDDTLIFMDEGFLHRGVSAFSDRPDRAAFQHYLSCLSHEFLTVHVATPFDVALNRATNRSKAAPFLGRTTLHDEGMANLQEFNALVQIACTTRQKAGKPVLTIDGTLPPALAALQLAAAFRALATPDMYFAPDAALPKRRRKPVNAINQA